MGAIGSRDRRSDRGGDSNGFLSSSNFSRRSASLHPGANSNNGTSDRTGRDRIIELTNTRIPDDSIFSNPTTSYVVEPDNNASSAPSSPTATHPRHPSITENLANRIGPLRQSFRSRTMSTFLPRRSTTTQGPSTLSHDSSASGGASNSPPTAASSDQTSAIAFSLATGAPSSSPSTQTSSASAMASFSRSDSHNHSSYDFSHETSPSRSASASTSRVRRARDSLFARRDFGFSRNSSSSRPVSTATTTVTPQPPSQTNLDLQDREIDYFNDRFDGMGSTEDSLEGPPFDDPPRWYSSQRRRRMTQDVFSGSSFAGRSTRARRGSVSASSTRSDDTFTSIATIYSNVTESSTSTTERPERPLERTIFGPERPDSFPFFTSHTTASTANAANVTPNNISRFPSPPPLPPLPSMPSFPPPPHHLPTTMDTAGIASDPPSPTMSSPPFFSSSNFDNNTESMAGHSNGRGERFRDLFRELASTTPGNQESGSAVHIIFASSPTGGPGLMIVVLGNDHENEGGAEPRRPSIGRDSATRRNLLVYLRALGDSGSTYEELLALQERLGFVNRGVPREQMDSIQKAEYEVGLFEDPRCSICLFDYAEKESLRVLPCHHHFHADCVDTWLLDHCNSCPLCRRAPVSSPPPPDVSS